MQAALAVLTNRVLLPHIVGFHRGFPYALLQLEPAAYTAEAASHPYLTRHTAGGAFLLHHALLTNNARMVELLFRMRQQPYYAAMPWFQIDGVLQLVCTRGCSQHLQLLQERQDFVSVWPASLLRVTMDALECRHPKRSPEDQKAFATDQKNKALWLLDHHPEACIEHLRPHGVLLSSLEHRAFLLKLIAAGVVDLSSFAGASSQKLDVSLVELLLREYPSAITREFVNACCQYGNLAVIQLLHDRESELPPECFSAAAMDAAAAGGQLDVVRFLHENRLEGCTSRAMDDASRRGHLDVVKFLQENRTVGCTSWAIESIRFNCGETAAARMAEFFVEHYPQLIPDPTSWAVNEAVKTIQSAWAKSAVLSDDPAVALRAAVIQLTDLDEFKQFHAQKHPAGCADEDEDRHEHWLLRLAIDLEKDAFAIFLVNHCDHVKASVTWGEVLAAGSDSRTLNLELIDLLMAECATPEGRENDFTGELNIAAEASNLPFVKALLDRGVPCTKDVLTHALWGFRSNVAEYLMENYPELITSEVLCSLADRGDHEYLYKLCVSHPHLVDSSVVETIFCGENSSANLTWEVLRFVHEHFPTVSIHDREMGWVWLSDLDDFLVFMWLVWKDPKTATSFAQADRFYRLRLYSRLHACVPSLFADVPHELPWCCQLRFLRQRVENGELTLEDVETARSEAMCNAT